ncbi:NRDE protein-domain-containing protein [Dichotomocladium elegans]|nr:NRDE protein-domain-containing protein [Dichotomocladium elegans]
MCILFWTVENHPRYRFIFASNRDEFLDRPTAPAHFWPAPFDSVLAGTDLEAGATPKHDGTWVGITRQGRFAALTNYRETNYTGRCSRGALTRDYFFGANDSAMDYMKDLEARAEEYGGFSLICMNLGKSGSQDMVYFSNRDNTTVTPLAPGVIYGLSNSVLENPWEKVTRGREILQGLIQQTELSEEELVEQLFKLLRTTTDLGSVEEEQDVEYVLEKAKERIFVQPFIYQNAYYGTRSSTVILMDYDGNVTFVERDHYERVDSDRTDDDGGSTKGTYIPVSDRERWFHFTIEN